MSSSRVVDALRKECFLDFESKKQHIVLNLPGRERDFHEMFPWVWGWQFVTFCGVNADKITGTSRQILFEGLPPQPQDLHGFFKCPIL